MFEASLVCRLKSQKQTVNNIAKRSSFLERNRVKKFSISCLTSLCASLRSSWSPASAISQMSSTVSSASLPQHFWDPRIFCCRTNSLEFTDHLCDPAVDSEQFRRDLKTYLFACSPDIRSVSAFEVFT